MARAPQGQAKRVRGRPPALLIFWGVFAVIVLGGVAVLQILGPPPVQPHPAADFHHRPAPQQAAVAKPAPGVQADRGTGGRLAPGQPIPGPLPGLLGPAASNPQWLVPKVGGDGTPPMLAYAASASPLPGPHVAILVAGIGDDATQSQAAATTLPAAVSLAMTPYGRHIGDIAAMARAAGHELLLALPMQEADPATENAGNEALVMAGPITLDQPMLDWSLSRLQGYAGVTDAIGATQGAGFMVNPNARAWLLQEIADHGLFFVDARQEALPFAWSRAADVVIDPVRAPEQERAQLNLLAADARLQGAALGILLNPAPAALTGLRSWLQGLGAQGITLEPVSALVAPPNAPATAISKTATVTP